MGLLPVIIDSPGPKSVIVELINVLILLAQRLEAVLLLIQRALLQGRVSPGVR